MQWMLFNRLVYILTLISMRQHTNRNMITLYRRISKYPIQYSRSQRAGALISPLPPQHTQHALQRIIHDISKAQDLSYDMTKLHHLVMLNHQRKYREQISLQLRALLQRSRLISLSHLFVTLRRLSCCDYLAFSIPMPKRLSFLRMFL